MVPVVNSIAVKHAISDIENIFGFIVLFFNGFV